MYRNQTFTFGDFAGNGLHLALRLISRSMDYEARIRFGRKMGIQVFGRLPSYRRRIDHNLKLVFPEMDENWRDHIQEECANNVGQSLMEHMHISEFAERIGNLNVTGPGAASITPQTSAILITGHFGQWEGIRIAWRHITSNDCAFLFRPHNNGFFDRHWQQYLARAGEPIIAKQSAGRRLMEDHVQNGGTVLFANDQHLENSDYLDFMGAPARTAKTAARMALKWGIPLIPAYAVRRSNLFDYDVIFEEAIPPSTATEMTQVANDSLAARVRANPEQYFWAHRRWR